MELKEKILGYLKLDELKDNFLKLIEAKFELKKLEIQEKLESKLAPLVFYLCLSLLSIFSFFLLNLLLGLWLNRLLDSYFLGFLILFAFYAIVTILFYFSKEKLLAIFKEKIKKEMDEMK
jgi:hypothetical protein